MKLKNQHEKKFFKVVYKISGVLGREGKFGALPVISGGKNFATLHFRETVSIELERTAALSQSEDEKF